MEAVDAVPVVGEPMVFGIGFGVLLVLVATGSWARSLVTVAHEGGHMVVAVLTLRGHTGFTLEDGGGGATGLVKTHWSIGDLVTRFAGYPAPSLLGLGGAFLLAGGNAWLTLWIGAALSVLAVFQAANPLARTVTVLAFGGVGWAGLAGSPQVQAAVAVGLVWWMLLGGAYYASTELGRGEGSDAYWLARRTLIPRIVWHAVWTVIAVVCLWVGGRALLMP